MKKIDKNSLTLNLVTRFYNLYVDEGLNSKNFSDCHFTDFELILLIKLILDLRDTTDLESVLC